MRVVWTGGITIIEDEELGERERKLYSVTVQQPDGSLSEVVPFALVT